MVPFCFCGNGRSAAQQQLIAERFLHQTQA